MKLTRNAITPYLGFTFVVVAFTGILMFFHLLDDYTEVVHELLGLTFAFFAVLHLTINWKSIVNYKRKKKLFLPSIVILFISFLLIIIGKEKDNLERELSQRMIQSPICYSFKTLNIDYFQADKILKQNNIAVTDTLQSIEEISAKNKKSPEEILKLIFKQSKK